MKAVFTKYIAQTNARPSRIKAYDQDGNSYTISKDEAEDISGEGKMIAGEGTHRVAVRGLCKKMGWDYGEMVAGGLKNGYVFVWVK